MATTEFFRLKNVLLVLVGIVILYWLFISLKMDGKREKEIKIICWIPIKREMVEHGESIKRGWGKECSEFIILSDFEDNSRNIFDISKKMNLNRKEEYDDLALKVWYCWEFLYHKFYKQKDAVFLKADSDTYMLMDNYKKFVSKFDLSIPFYIGRNMKTLEDPNRQYVQGGSSITLNYLALSFMIQNFNHPDDSPYKIKECSKDYFKELKKEDLSVADCMRMMGINPAFTRDENNRELFMYYSPEKMYFTKMDDSDQEHWYRKISFNSKMGPECCSPYACAFHQVTKEFQSQKLYYNWKSGKWEWK